MREHNEVLAVEMEEQLIAMVLSNNSYALHSNNFNAQVCSFAPTGILVARLTWIIC